MELPFWLLIVFLVGCHGTNQRMNQESDITEVQNWNKDFPYKGLRLPSNIVPKHYELQLHPNITSGGNFKFTGDVRITFTVTNATDSIILHSKELTHIYTSVYEDAPGGEEVKVRKVQTHTRHELLLVKVENDLVAAKQYVLRIMFAGFLKQRLDGFYLSVYKNEKGETRYLATTDFEPTGARLAFPCFDEPAMKATFTIMMIREKHQTSLSNMPVERTVLRSDGLLTDYFQKSVKMSSYLVAFVVSEFAHLSTTSSRGIKIRVWAPEHMISQAKYAIEVTPKILDFYEKFFQIEFPLPKQDLIGIPDYGQGAMENWGLITYRLTALLYDENESSTANKQHVVEVIAHELAHQWFGNLVTMKWWNDLWLNEGFARFVEYIGVGVVTENWDEMTQFVASNLQKSLSLDSKRNSHPISLPVSDPADIGALFDGISYAKGASILRMMRDFLGADRFAKGLATYLKKHKYGNAVGDDLWAALTEATGSEINVKKIMDTWTLQMGYPVINVERSAWSNVVTFTQERFVKNVVQTFLRFNYKWEIPLTYYFQNNEGKQRKWMHLQDASAIVPWPQTYGWIKVNSDAIGFYRVNYDRDNWKALSMQLKNHHTEFSPADRSNLIDDAFAIASIGKLNYEQALDLTGYLVNETHLVPVLTALNSLGSVGKILKDPAGYANYQNYILRLLTPLVTKLGWQDTGSHLDKLLRGVVLNQAIIHGHKDAVRDGLKLYREWMTEKKRIPANVRKAVYLSGSKYGSKEDWYYMLNRFKTTIYPSEKQVLMNSLAATSDPTVLRWYLNNSINKDVIRPAETCSLISKIARNPLGKRITRNFVKKNWDYLIRNYGPLKCLAQVIPAVFGGKSITDFAEAEWFLHNHPLGSGRLAAKQTLASIRNNMDWLVNNEKTVIAWLTREMSR